MSIQIRPPPYCWVINDQPLKKVFAGATVISEEIDSITDISNLVRPLDIANYAKMPLSMTVRFPLSLIEETAFSVYVFDVASLFSVPYRIKIRMTLCSKFWLGVENFVQRKILSV